MNRYPAYKPSSIEWIGEIPKHWIVRDLKYNTYIKARVGWHGLKSDEFTNKGAYCVTGTDFEKGLIAWEDCYRVSLDRYDEDPYIQLKQGDLLITKDGTIGKTAVVKSLPGPATLNSGVFVVRPIKDYTSDFLYWVLNSSVFTEFVNFNSKGSTIIHLYQDTFCNLPLLIPPKEEQVTITTYLEQKTKVINDTIAKKQLLIQLLQEERTAMINQAVTRGLDPYVKLKPSGVEWLGDVPEHWKITKIKFIKHKSPNAFVDGPFGSNLKSMHFVDNGDVYVVESGLVTSGVFKLRKFKTITYDHFQTINRSECKEGDIIISKIGANYGMAGILPKLDKPSVVSGNSLKLTVNSEVTSNRFIHLVITMLKVEGAFTTLVTSTAQPALSLGELNDVKFALPPIDEQVQIVDFILQKSKELDDAVDIAYKEIDLLNEYRCTLINEVVTGKVCVLT